MRALIAFALAALAAFCAPAALAATLAGTLWTRGAPLRAPDSVVIVELLDISRADAAARVVAATRVAPHGRARVPFALDYEASALDPRFTYVVSARLVADGRLAARVMAPPRIDPRHPPRRLALRLTPVAGRAPPGERPAADLVGATWALEALEGARLAAPATLTFRADGRVAGHSGCNRFSGAYSAQASHVRLGPLAATRMACRAPQMIQERAFLAVLERARLFRLEGGRLSLYDAGGTRVALLRRGA